MRRNLRQAQLRISLGQPHPHGLNNAGFEPLPAFLSRLSVRQQKEPLPSRHGDGPYCYLKNRDCSIATGADSKIVRQEQGESTWDSLNASEFAPNSANGLIPSLIAWAKPQPPGNVAIDSKNPGFEPCHNSGHGSNAGHSSGVAQGQRSLNRCSGRDFQHEVFAPTATAAFHSQTVAAGMLLQQRPTRRVLCYATAKLLRDEAESMVPNIDLEQVRKLAGWGLTQNDRASFVGWSQSLLSLRF